MTVNAPHVPHSLSLTLIMIAISAVLWIGAFAWYFYGTNKLQRKLSDVMTRLRRMARGEPAPAEPKAKPRRARAPANH